MGDHISSGGIATNNGLKTQGQISEAGMTAFRLFLRPMQLPIRWAPEPLYRAAKQQTREAATHLLLLSSSGMVEPYFHSPVLKTKNTAGRIRCTDHATPSIRKRWH
jgi:hypothetical protein